MSSGIVWDPAGSDRQLAKACMELRAGRTGLAREVLAESRWDFPLRGHRSLTLGSVVAARGEAEQWLTEAPNDPDACLLYARVTLIRALRAADTDDKRTPELAQIADRACLRAAEADNTDPTPWVSMLALARLGHKPVDPPMGLDTPGPWDLMSEVWQRDQESREGHHRLLSCFFARYGGSLDAMWQVAHWFGQWAPATSSAQILQLAALAEHYRVRRDSLNEHYRNRRDGAASDLAPDGQWAAPQAVDITRRIYDNWFFSVENKPGLVPVADFSLLAHALYMGQQEDLPRAARVLRAMSPYASSYPWSLFGDPAAVLTRAYGACRVPVPGAS